MVSIKPILKYFSELALTEEDAHYHYVLNQKQLLKLRFMQVTGKSTIEIRPLQHHLHKTELVG